MVCVGHGDADGMGMGGLGTLSCMSIDDATLLMTHTSNNNNSASSGMGMGGSGGGMMGVMGGQMMPLGGDQYQHANASMLRVSSEDWNEPWRNGLDSGNGGSHLHGGDGGGIQLGPGARAAAALIASNAADR